MVGQVEALLGALARQGGALDSLTPGGVLADLDDAEALDEHQQIGAWRVGKPLGSGGQGTVYAVTRSGEGFEQSGALKLLNSRLANPSALRRFERERRLLASLDHPGIPTLLDGGVLEDGSPWLVVELVQGETLSSRLRQAPLPQDEAVDLGISLCDTLSHAHQKLIAHSDLKPGNVMLDQGGRVRLLDFGIARLVDDASHAIAQTGPAYTPAFAAPEQINQQPATTATDIYGAGAVLLAALTGHPPFTADNVSAQLNQILREEPQLPARLPTDLAAIILCCLRKEPSQRYASIDALQADLRAFREGQAVSARAGGWRYRFGKLVARHRAASAALGLLLMGGLASAGVYVSQQSAIREQRDLAQLEAERANSMLDFVEKALAGLDSNLNSSPTVGQFLRQAVDQSEEISDPVARARLLNLLGLALHGQGETAAATQAMALALPLLESTELRGGDLHVNALLALSDEAIANGRTAEAIRLSEEALDLARKENSPVTLEYELSAVGQLSWALAENGENDRVRELTAPYLDAMQEIANDEEFNAYGMISIMAGRVAESDERRYELASQMHDAVLEAFPDRPAVHVREKVVLGRRALALGSAAEALRLFEEAEAAARAATDGEPFVASYAIMQQAAIHRTQGDFARSSERLAVATPLVASQGQRMEQLLAAEQILLAVDANQLDKASKLLAEQNQSPPNPGTSAAQALGEAKARLLLAQGAAAEAVKAAAPGSLHARIAGLRESCSFVDEPEPQESDMPSLSYRLWKMASARCAGEPAEAGQLRDELVRQLGATHWMVQ